MELPLLPDVNVNKLKFWWACYSNQPYGKWRERFMTTNMEPQSVSKSSPPKGDFHLERKTDLQLGAGLVGIEKKQQMNNNQQEEINEKKITTPINIPSSNQSSSPQESSILSAFIGSYHGENSP